jgi:hypothetical protein
MIACTFADLGQYSKHFIVFITYEQAQQARVFHYTRLEGLPRIYPLSCSADEWGQQAVVLHQTRLESLARNILSILFGQFISNKENEVM